MTLRRVIPFLWIWTAWLGSSELRAVNVWITTGNRELLLHQQPDVVFQATDHLSGRDVVDIYVDPDTPQQSISGFGAALTDSSAWLLQERLTAIQRENLMRQLFSTKAGIGISYLRIPIGASDFTATDFYTCNDSTTGAPDPEQRNFTIARDRQYTIPTLLQALSYNPQLRFMATPWSAPAWMKSNHSLMSGELRPEWEASYALYLQKFIDAYAMEGIAIDTISVQNEPRHISDDYPTMLMSAQQQARFIGQHLGPRLHSRGVHTKILAYDHNWDDVDYPRTVLSDPQANRYLTGTAFHAYAGSVAAQSEMHAAFPEKDIYFTEISGGNWAQDFGDNLVWTCEHILIGTTRNWAKTALLWNLALNENHGPHRGGCTDCRGVVTIDEVTGKVTPNVEFYALAHFSRFVEPNAQRIESTSSAMIPTTSFLNPSGSRVLVVLNRQTTPQAIRVLEGGNGFPYIIPPRSVATFVWEHAGADFDNGDFELGGFEQGGGSWDGWTSLNDHQEGMAIRNHASPERSHASTERSHASPATFDAGREPSSHFLEIRGQSDHRLTAQGVSQGITVQAGQTVSVSALYRLHRTQNAAQKTAAASSGARIKIEYYSEYGALADSAQRIGETTSLYLACHDTDTWRPVSLSGLTPQGTVEARLVLEFLAPEDPSASVAWDHVHFGLIPSLTVRP